jgi:unsaturated rhamnogalacturonyl hydrolase
LAQIDTFLEHAIGENGWPYHGFDAETLRPLGMAGWGRGVGWLLLGLTDTALELPAGDDQDRLVGLAELWLKKVANVQRSDGHWSWSLSMPSATADSSVTALVRYCIARLLETYPGRFADFGQTIERCSTAIDKATVRSGRVGQSSGEASAVGAYSEIFGANLWAQGPTVAGDQILQSAQRPVTSVA